MRIALAPKVLLPDSIAELVLELAHELGHVKMDARFDSYLVETFAAAVSLKILKDMRFEEERNRVIEYYVNKLPSDLRSAISQTDWKAAAQFWQSEIPQQSVTTASDSRNAFIISGALLLEANQQPVWANLLGAAAISKDCHGAVENKICTPNIDGLSDLTPALVALGYPPGTSFQ